MPLNKLKNFDIDDAEVTMWVFKKWTRAGSLPRFTGRFVDTTKELDDFLKNAVKSERKRITEVQVYSLLSLTNENSALSISTVETHGNLIVEQSATETPEKKANKLKKIQNSAFYVIKFVSEDTVIHAVSKTDVSWHVRKVRNKIWVFYSDDQLEIGKSSNFNISPCIDFFILGGDILISNKRNFESILSYKKAHKEDFIVLQSEQEFIDMFVTTAPLVSYVGDNKVHLRRASAIRQKGHYKDSEFAERLRLQHKKLKLNIQFNSGGKIVPSSSTCKDIFQALLDHRLSSEFSQKIYDVQDGKAV